jgi:plastocyanin
MLRQPYRFAIAAVFAALLPAIAGAAQFQVEQKNMAFSSPTLKIKAGDTVEFKNVDPVSHNIFSISDAKTFDLGAFTTGQAKTVTFDKPGTVDVECAIHPSMKMKVEVEK